MIKVSKQICIIISYYNKSIYLLLLRLDLRFFFVFICMNITKCSLDRKKIHDMDLIFIELLISSVENM